MTSPDMILKRVADSVHGTFGVLLWEYRPFAVTVEDKWRDNIVGVSCVPAGDYVVKRCRTSPDYNFSDSPRFGDTFQIMDVSGRTYILFHGGNTHENTEGCIIVATYFGMLGGVSAVLGSKTHDGRGFNRFLSLLEGRDEFNLRIVDSTRDGA